MAIPWCLARKQCSSNLHTVQFNCTQWAGCCRVRNSTQLVIALSALEKPAAAIADCHQLHMHAPGSMAHGSMPEGMQAWACHHPVVTR